MYAFPKLLCSPPLNLFFPLPPMTMHVFEVFRVTPAPNSANSLAIPLTFFDLPWLVFNPVKRVFFYKITGSTREHFHSFILPKLKLSLSLVLRDYLPLCGRITWELNEPKPSIVVSQNDAILVTIAETDADFSLLSGYGQRPASELHNLLPEAAKVLSLQITLFPSQGFLHWRRGTPRRFRRKNVNHVRQSLGSRVQTAPRRKKCRCLSAGDSNSVF